MVSHVKNFEYDSIRQIVENVKGKGYNDNKLLLSYSIMNKYKLAIGLALLTAVFSGVNNFITKIAVTAVKDPVVFTTLKNAIVAVFIIGIIMWKKRSELKTLTPKQKKLLILIGIIGGSIPFILYFTGLKLTSALNASLIHKTLFVWVAIMPFPIFQ